MPSGNIGFVANGNITPSRFVIQDVTKDNAVTQAGAAGKCIGVSQMGTRRAPYSTLNDGFCAIAGEPVRIHQLGEECGLECGAAVVRGDRLKSDASGRGITAAAGDSAYAIAIQSGGAAGVIIQVQVVNDTIGAS